VNKDVYIIMSLFHRTLTLIAGREIMGNQCASPGFHSGELRTRINKSLSTSSASIHSNRSGVVVASSSDLMTDIADDSENCALSKQRSCCPLGNLTYCRDTSDQRSMQQQQQLRSQHRHHRQELSYTQVTLHLSLIPVRLR